MNNGILLELVVEIFQKLVSNDEIIITRRHIFKIDKNDNAEVDILLSGKFGTSEMKVALECRDRVQPQGKEWIQQIIGKRDDLRRFGIRHWIAISASGFTQPAKTLAERAGIEILVPYSVEPANPNDPGPHHLLKFQLHKNEWTSRIIKTEIGHEDISALDKLEFLLLNGGMNRLLIVCDDRKTLLHDHLCPLVSEAFKEIDSIENNWNSVKRVFRFCQISAEIDGISFILTDLEIEAILTKKKFDSDFRLITFSNYHLSKFIEMIGINSYTANDEKTYLIAGFKSGSPAKLVGCARTGSGAPIVGANLHFFNNQVNESGFQFESPN